MSISFANKLNLRPNADEPIVFALSTDSSNKLIIL